VERIVSSREEIGYSLIHHAQAHDNSVLSDEGSVAAPPPAREATVLPPPAPTPAAIEAPPPAPLQPFVVSLPLPPSLGFLPARIALTFTTSPSRIFFVLHNYCASRFTGRRSLSLLRTVSLPSLRASTIVT
jgi:hypothetical protein